MARRRTASDVTVRPSFTFGGGLSRVVSAAVHPGRWTEAQLIHNKAQDYAENRSIKTQWGRSVSPGSTANTWNSKHFFKSNPERNTSQNQVDEFEGYHMHHADGVAHDLPRQSSQHAQDPTGQQWNEGHQHVPGVDQASMESQMSQVPPNTNMLQTMQAHHEYYAALHGHSQLPGQGQHQHRMVHIPMMHAVDPTEIPMPGVFHGSMPMPVAGGHQGPMHSPMEFGFDPPHGPFHGPHHGPPHGPVYGLPHAQGPVYVYNPDAVPQQQGQAHRRQSQAGSGYGRRRTNSGKRLSPIRDYDGWRQQRTDPLHGPVFTRSPSKRHNGDNTLAPAPGVAAEKAAGPAGFAKRARLQTCKNVGRYGAAVKYVACDCSRCGPKRRTVYVSNFLPGLENGPDIQVTLANHFGRWGRVESIYVTGEPGQRGALVRFSEQAAAEAAIKFGHWKAVEGLSRGLSVMPPHYTSGYQPRPQAGRASEGVPMGVNGAPPTHAQPVAVPPRDPRPPVPAFHQQHQEIQHAHPGHRAYNPQRHQGTQARTFSPLDQHIIYRNACASHGVAPPPLMPQPRPHHGAGAAVPPGLGFDELPLAEYPHPARLPIYKTREPENDGFPSPDFFRGQPPAEDDLATDRSSTDEDICSDKSSAIRVCLPASPEQRPLAATVNGSAVESAEKVEAPGLAATTKLDSPEEAPQPVPESLQGTRPSSPPDEDADLGTVIRRPAKKQRKRLPSVWGSHASTLEVAEEEESEVSIPMQHPTTSGLTNPDKTHPHCRKENTDSFSAMSTASGHSGAIGRTESSLASSETVRDDGPSRVDGTLANDAKPSCPSKKAKKKNNSYGKKKRSDSHANPRESAGASSLLKVSDDGTRPHEPAPEATAPV